MTNAISKTTTQDVDKQQLVNRIIKNSTQLLEDYVLWNKCGWSDQEFGDLLGISAKTVKNRYMADARKQGLIEMSSKSRTGPRQVCSRNREQIVENSTPLIHPEIVEPHVPHVEPSDTSTSISGGVSNVQSEMDSRSDRYDKDAVSMGSANDRGAAEDLEEIVRLLNIVGQLTARNCDIRGPHFNEEQWYLVWASLDSEAREAKMRCTNYEAAIQRDCATIRAGVQARFGSGMGSDAAVF